MPTIAIPTAETLEALAAAILAPSAYVPTAAELAALGAAIRRPAAATTAAEMAELAAAFAA